MGGGPPGFTPGFTCPALLGNATGRADPFAYGAFTLYGRPFQHAVRLESTFVTSCRSPERPACGSHDPAARNARKLDTARFRLVPVRSPLLGSRGFFLFLQVLRCFSSLRSVRRYAFSAGLQDIDLGRFPASRRSPDQSLLSSSPGLSQPSHVLHRLSAPRHPPCTLCSLTTQSFRSSTRFAIHLVSKIAEAAAVSRPSRAYSSTLRRPSIADPDPPIVSRVASSSAPLRSERRPVGRRAAVAPCWAHDLVTAVVGLTGFEPLTSRLSGGRSNQLSYRPTPPSRPAARGADADGEEARRPRTLVRSGLYDELVVTARPEVLIILRKEVIQPQVPLRLPCYDLVPITELAFGAALPCG